MTPGWLITSQSEVCWYYFYDLDLLYIMSMYDLRSFVFGNHVRDTYLLEDKVKFRGQRKYKQLNDPWAVLIPIDKLMDPGHGIKIAEHKVLGLGASSAAA
jgi:hypothetical protein